MSMAIRKVELGLMGHFEVELASEFESLGITRIHRTIFMTVRENTHEKVVRTKIVSMRENSTYPESFYGNYTHVGSLHDEGIHFFISKS